MGKFLAKFLGGLAAVVLVFAGGMWASSQNVLGGLFGTGKTVITSEEIVKSITQEQKVVLLELAIEGFETADQEGEFLGKKVALANRKVIIGYEFSAQLGIDGKNVEVEQTGENSIKVLIPSFQFIGANDFKTTKVDEDMGLLGWTTGEINEDEVRNNIISEENKAAYVAKYSPLIATSAEAFYGSIIESIAPDMVVEFEFVDDISGSDSTVS
ncbi:MAG: hypothetical protein WAS54_07110 [Scrofimicrobium sp.]